MDYPLDNGISWPLNTWPDLGYGLPLPALTELTALVRSLNGHIFVPGLETYANQSALNPAASALDSQVGYVGSAATQGLGENLVLDSEFTTGTASALANTWATAGAVNNVNIAVVGKGVNPDGTTYQDFRIYTTAPASATTFPHIYSVATSYVIPAFPGQLFAQQLKIKLLSGSFSGFANFTHRLRFTDSAGTITDEQIFSSLTVATGEYLTLSGAGRSGNANTARVSPRILGTINTGSTCDVTIRICNWQLERGHPTNYTPTYGTAVSRGVFASAAQGTLANTPKLVTLGSARGLEFDGSTDHLFTDIPTPSSGYICVIGRQTANTSAFRAWLGSNTYNTVGVNIGITETGDAGIYTNNGTNNQGAITSGLGYVPGTLAIIDADWQPSFRSIRVNGGNEASSSITADPATSACFILGGRNSATWPNVTLNLPVAGQFFSCIIIPGVTLPAATKQRIRKLVGQIYGVQTQ